MGKEGSEFVELLKNFIYYSCEKANKELKCDIITNPNGECPRQIGTVDCGIYVLLNSKLIIKKEILKVDSYTPDEATKARKLIKYELIKISRV